MRDPHRIYNFLFAMYEIWNFNYPDMRFGQMMEMFRAKYGDSFYMEDDEYLEKFRELFEKEENKYDYFCK